MSDLTLLTQAEPVSFESSTSQLRKWQTKLLSGTLLLGILAAVLVLGLSFFDPGNPNQRILIIGSIVLGFGSIVLLLLQNVSFWLKSIISLIFFYIFVNSVFFFYGWSPASLVGLTGFTAICTALLFRRSIRYGLIVSVLTLVLWAALTSSGSFSPIPLSILFTDGFIVCVIGFFTYLALNQLKELYLSKIDENQEKVKEILEVNSKYQKLTKEMQHQDNLVQTLFLFSQNQPDQLEKEIRIQSFVDQMSKEFDLQWIFIYLVDIYGESLELKFGSSEISRDLIEKHHHYSIGGPSIVSQSVSKNQVLAAPYSQSVDLGISLNGTSGNESAIAVPITSKERSIGTILLISDHLSVSDAIDRSVLQIIAILLSRLLETGQDYSKIPTHETRMLSFDNFLESEKTRQFTYPEGEILPVQDKDLFRDIELISPSIRPLGKMKILGRQLDQDEIETMNTLAKHAANAITKLAAITKIQKVRVSEEKSKEIANRFSGKKKMEDVLRAAVSELGKLPDVVDAGIALVSPEETIATPRSNGRKYDPNK